MKSCLMLRLEQLRTDGGTQMRATLDGDHLERLALALDAAGELEAVDAVHDRTDYWLWNGFHRLMVYSDAGRKKIPARIRPGTQRVAVLLAAGANTHRAALARNAEDIRRAVETLLRDPEWARWPDTKICEAVGLKGGWGRLQVADIRRELSCPSGKMRTVERSGVSYPMNTQSIGRGEGVSGQARATPTARPMPNHDRVTAAPEPAGVWQRFQVPAASVPGLIAVAEAHDCDSEKICCRGTVACIGGGLRRLGRG